VVGAGIMGHGIAQVCAQAGNTVTLADSVEAMLKSAKTRMEKSLIMLIGSGLLSGVTIEEAMANVCFTTNLSQAANDTELLFEAIPENLELKRRLYEQLDQICRSDTIFAGNGSHSMTT